MHGATGKMSAALLLPLEAHMLFSPSFPDPCRQTFSQSFQTKKNQTNPNSFILLLNTFQMIHILTCLHTLNNCSYSQLLHKTSKSLPIGRKWKSRNASTTIHTKFHFLFKQVQTIAGVLLFSVQLFQVRGDAKMIMSFCGEQRSEISNVNTLIT